MSPKPLVVLAILALSFVLSNAQRTKIESLPFVEPPLKEMYSGRLTLSAEKSVYYILVKSENTDPDAPLILWLNGGPGCSSLIGFFKEIGPYVMPDGEPAFVPNEYSWSKKGSLLFLELPVETGFSTYTGKDQLSDDSTAADGIDALKQFLILFPEYVGKKLWLTGESYAGLILPKIANKMDDSVKLNLAGLMMGNALIDPEVLYPAVWDFMWGHNLFGVELKDILSDVCTKDEESARCLFAKRKIYGIIADMNFYDIKGYCYHAVQSPGEYAPWWLGALLSQSGGRPLKTKSCIDFEELEGYLNLTDVRTAMNVPKEVMEKPWYTCRFKVYDHYTSEIKGSTQDIIALKTKGIPIFLFSGDTDAVVPVTSTLAFLKELKGLELTRIWSPWYTENPEQLGGFTIAYTGLTFASVIGAGHMAAKIRRREVFQLISRFMKDQKI